MKAVTAVEHADEESLERYSMGTLAERESAPLEEHLLICQTCRDRLEFLDTYQRSMRAALKSVPCKSVVRVRSFT